MPNLNGLSSVTEITMPVIFFGHGSPMNAIENNLYTQTLRTYGQSLVRPKAILCVSAHWMTEGTWVTAMDKPKTIHDFYGFPQELFNIQYPAPGHPEIAAKTKQMIESLAPLKVGLDQNEWGLDHGTWSVLRHVFPEAQIPVIQLSLDMTRPPEYHFQLGQYIQGLRNQGVLIVASGNIVHNLRRIQWDPKSQPYDWAVEFDQWVKGKLENKDFSPLVHDYLKSSGGKESVPTPDHYWPMLTILGAVQSKDQIRPIYEEMQNASISMRCFEFSS